MLLPMLLLVSGSFLFVGSFASSIGAPAVHWSRQPAPSAGESKARQRFGTLCITCHGSSGRGNGPAGMALQPRPRDFTDFRWQDSVTDQHIKQIILRGGAAVGKSPLMPANPDLEGQDEVLNALAKIVRSFRNPDYEPLEEAGNTPAPEPAEIATPTEIGFSAYQKRFAEDPQNGEETDLPSGPIWLQPEVLAEKEACTSCHLGVEDEPLLYARPPYGRHSGHYLEDHPPQRFGCTVCHGGVAGALTFADAEHAEPDNHPDRAVAAELWLAQARCSGHGTVEVDQRPLRSLS